MANQERGEVDLVARDRTYTLVLTTNGACALEAASGRLMEDIVSGTIRGKVVDMRWLIWAALQEHHAADIATPLDAGRLIDDAGGLATVWRTLNTFVAANADHTPAAEKAGSATAPDPPIAQAAVSGSDSTSMPAVSG